MRFWLIFISFLYVPFVTAQTTVIDSLERVLEGARTPEQRADVLMMLCNAAFREGVRDKVDLWATELVEQGRVMESDYYRGKGFLALLNHDFITDEERIPELVDSSLVYLKRQDDQVRLMQIHALYGYWLCEQFDCEGGLLELAKADSLAQHLELSPKIKTQRRLTYLMALSSCGNYSLIPPLIAESVAMEEQLDNVDRLSTILGLGCTAFRELNQLDSADHYLGKMEALLPRLNKEDNRSSFYGHASRNALARGYPEKSLRLMERSLAILRENETDAPYLVAPKQVDAGRAAYQAGQLQKSLAFYQTAQEQIERAGDPQALARFYTYRGDTHAAMGSLAQASRFHQKGRFLTDSLEAAKHQIRIERLTTEFETERVKRELAQAELARSRAEAVANRYRLIGLVSIIGLLLALVAWLWLSTRRRRKALEYAKKQAELRYALLRARMNPHFIFNSLNSIQSFFSNQRFGEGNDYLSTFSHLVRRILNQTTQTSIPLSEELETLAMYLQLEKLRLGDNLTYRLIVADDLETDLLEVPPLVLQPFVENAIWHGVAPKNAPGLVEVRVSYDEASESIRAVIEDDGVGLGRSVAEGHRSQGIEITRDRLGPAGSVSVNNRKTPGVRTELIIPLREANLIL